MRITFLLPVVSDALHYRRIKALEKVGALSRVLAFERPYYPGKLKPGEYESLGHIGHGNYASRLIPYLRAVAKVRVALAGADVLYVFGLDLLMLGWLASRGLTKRLKIVYEVDDIREILMGDGLVSRLLRSLERFLLRDVARIVTVTEPLLQGYFREMQGLTDFPCQVIENKLEIAPVARHERPLPRDGVLRIGYFGLIRCRQSWQVLKQVAERGAGRIKVYARGISMLITDLEQEAQSVPNLDYGGAYLVPDDLGEMYGQVDLVWVAYYHGRSNILWGHAHRFFEACYYGLPMVGQVGTPDGQIIQELGLGTCVDLADVESSADQILQIAEDDWRQWQRKVIQVPPHVYVYTDEHHKLFEAIR